MFGTLAKRVVCRPGIGQRLMTQSRAFSSAVDGRSQYQASLDKSNYDSSNYCNYINQDRLPHNEADPTNRNFAYLTMGTGKFLYASLARVTVVKFISSLSASADVLALSTIEVDVSKVAEGMSTTVKWRGKPVFFRHRTEQEIQAAVNDDGKDMIDPETDGERFTNPKWVVVLGVCTHLGCVPINKAGDYGGWFCPCHGSHYDTSGRIRRGPAPLNLEVPVYKFVNDNTILVG